MQVLERAPELRQAVLAWQASGKRIAFVPTMGNLHQGHLALVDRAHQLADRTVVSIFVNPTQFVADEDLESYPRTLARDTELLAQKEVDLVFVPTVAELYPFGSREDQTRVEVPALDGILCGAFRPGHFRGVATVVTKLFNLVQPQFTVFGEKDYQQLLLLKRLVHELCFPIAIIGVPTVREPDGLALSSRNSYLSDAERRLAPRLYAVLEKAAAAALRDPKDLTGIEGKGTTELACCGFRPEYFSFRRSHDLAPPLDCDKHLVVLTAAWLGRTRLIDHVLCDIQ
ncbi:MAG: pantoate--beta-alanine ligase [Gammaproteobacteria bacterium]